VGVEGRPALDAEAEGWLRQRVRPTGAVELVHDRSWAQVWRVPTAEGDRWFKACAPVQAHEPRLSAQLFARWPDRVAEVLAHDGDRAWLLLDDAGAPVADEGNPPSAWLQALPAYAELQRGEAPWADEHVQHGVPDLRLGVLPTRFQELVRRELPVDASQAMRLRGAVQRVVDLSSELASCGVPETVQHDDLHMFNLFRRGGRLRVLDWGDSSVSHPFASLLVTFHFLQVRNGLDESDPWVARLRDAYLEPWGPGLREVFDLALRVGTVAHAVAWSRQREALPAAALASFDVELGFFLRRSLAVLGA
jgi:hypothetical protein